MKLRGKLALTLALSVIPVALLVYAAGARFAHNVAVEAMVESARNQHASLQERCEEGRFGGRRGPRRRGPRPTRVRFYDEDLSPSMPIFRPLEPELAAGLRESDTVSHVSPNGGRRVLALRLGEGRCSVIVVQRPEPQQPGLGFLLALVPALVAAFIALLAAGPIVRRIRHLRRAVEGEGSIRQAGDDEIAELSQVIQADRTALQDKVEALAKRDAALSRYVANTMHDVMIPLTVLQGHLINLDAVQPGEDTRRALEESHYIASLLQNLSAAARLEGAIPVRKVDGVDLGELVERVVARHAPIARAKGIALNHATPQRSLYVNVDPTLVERAMSNLVHNAVRYGAKGGHVAVVLSAADRWEFKVLDDGPGVSAKDLAKLGEARFRSEEARSRNPEGQGLGIAITREVAEHHALDLVFARGDGPDERPGLCAIIRQRLPES